MIYHKGTKRWGNSIAMRGDGGKKREKEEKLSEITPGDEVGRKWALSRSIPFRRMELPQLS